MELKTKVIELLGRALAEERAFLEGLPEEERAALGAVDRWGPKDIIGHLADWNERLAANLAAGARGQAPVSYPNYLEVNDQGFLEHRDKPWTDVMAYEELALRHLAEQVRQRSEAELRSTAPWNEGPPVWQRVLNTAYVHSIQIHLCPAYDERGARARADQLQEEAARGLLDLDERAAWQGTVRYNQACHLALTGRKEAAIARLGEALALNPELREWSRQDSDLACLHAEPGYLALYTAESPA